MTQKIQKSLPSFLSIIIDDIIFILFKRKSNYFKKMYNKPKFNTYSRNLSFCLKSTLLKNNKQNIIS